MIRPAALSLSTVLLLAGCATLPDLRSAVSRLTSPTALAPDTRLAEAVRHPERCQALLREEGVAFTPARDQVDGEFCVVTNAVLLGATPVRTSPARPMMSCPLAAGFVLWSRYSVEPAAREMLGAELRQVDHYGVYACRRVDGQPEGRPSAHARAEALDVGAFRFSNGKRVSVEADWPKDSVESQFLHRVRQDACRVFGTVLSPDYNAAHADHLHFDQQVRGFGTVCR